MKFIEAIRELKDGRCEGIRWEGDTHFIILKEGILEWEDGVDLFPSISAFLSEDCELVNPKPEYEIKNEERWVYTNHSGKEQIVRNEPFLPPDLEPAVKIILPVKVEIKPKVKHREEVKQLDCLFNPISSPFVYQGKLVKLFAEWEE